MTREARTVFISDVHLGCRFAQPELFLRFLRGIECERIYILGDFIDGWKLRSGFRWPAINNQILTHMLGLIERGTEIYYTPGNHDQFLRLDEVQGVMRLTNPKLRIADEFIFEALDGRRFLVIHGDVFDTIEANAQWLSLASSYVYDPLLTLNWYISQMNRDNRRSPYAACNAIKGGVKRMIKFLSSYQQQLLDHARQQGCHGVICGHIHTPDIFTDREMTYCNTGDWIENCTALVEYYDGSLKLESHYHHGNRTIDLLPELVS